MVQSPIRKRDVTPASTLHWPLLRLHFGLATGVQDSETKGDP